MSHVGGLRRVAGHGPLLVAFAPTLQARLALVVSTGLCLSAMFGISALYTKDLGRRLAGSGASDGPCHDFPDIAAPIRYCWPWRLRGVGDSRAAVVWCGGLTGATLQTAARPPVRWLGIGRTWRSVDGGGGGAQLFDRSAWLASGC